MKRFALFVVIVAAIAGGYWLSSQKPASNASVAPGPAPGSAASGNPADLSPSAVLSIKVGKPSALSAKARDSAVPTLGHEYDTARMLKPLYDRLTAPGGPSTPEAKFILYKILATCASRTDRKPDAPPKQSVAERRKALADNISDSSPDKQKRLQAFDALASRCDGLENLTTTGADLDRLREEAARAGDPGARASQVAHDVFELHTTPETPAGKVPINETQLADLRQVLASHDPDAILAAGTILSNTFPNLVLEVGPNHDEINGAAAMAAWRLLACEYGMDCGPDSRSVMAACAYQGQCGAGNIPDLVFYYQVTPNQAQLIDQYRQAFRSAVEGGDLGQLQADWRNHRPDMSYGFTTYP
jgi:hypothetical protein